MTNSLPARYPGERKMGKRNGSVIYFRRSPVCQRTKGPLRTKVPQKVVSMIILKTRSLMCSRNVVPHQKNKRMSRANWIKDFNLPNRFLMT